MRERKSRSAYANSSALMRDKRENVRDAHNVTRRERCRNMSAVNVARNVLRHACFCCRREAKCLHAWGRRRATYEARGDIIIFIILCARRHAIQRTKQVRAPEERRGCARAERTHYQNIKQRPLVTECRKSALPCS